MSDHETIFTDYSSDSTVISDRKTSGIKTLLKESIAKEEIEKYGQSKPTRILIRAKISDG